MISCQTRERRSDSSLKALDHVEQHRTDRRAEACPGVKHGLAALPIDSGIGPRQSHERESASPVTIFIGLPLIQAFEVEASLRALACELGTSHQLLSGRENSGIRFHSASLARISAARDSCFGFRPLMATLLANAHGGARACAVHCQLSSGFRDKWHRIEPVWVSVGPFSRRSSLLGVVKPPPASQNALADVRLASAQGYGTFLERHIIILSSQLPLRMRHTQCLLSRAIFPGIRRARRSLSP